MTTRLAWHSANRSYAAFASGSGSGSGGVGSGGTALTGGFLDRRAFDAALSPAVTTVAA